jgi:thiol-disulfide isomerase/thioredoxin
MRGGIAPMRGGRMALIVALVGLAGLAAGFLSYRVLQPRAPLTATAPQPGTSPATHTLESAPDAASAPDGSAAPRTVPVEVPQITLPDPSGARHALRDYLGHPLIINFWATWCAPCRREMPLLGQLRRQYHHQGLEIVGIAVDFSAAVRTFLRTSPVAYPVLIAEQDGLAQIGRFGMEPVLPFSVFADRQGRIVAVKAGELHSEEANAILAGVSAIDAGQVTLPVAQEQLRAQLEALAAQRARAQQNGP